MSDKKRMNKPFPNGRFSAGSTTLSRTGLAPPQVVLFWSTSFVASNNSLLFQESFERRILTRHLQSLASGKKLEFLLDFPYPFILMLKPEKWMMVLVRGKGTGAPLDLDDKTVVSCTLTIQTNVGVETSECLVQQWGFSSICILYITNGNITRKPGFLLTCSLLGPRDDDSK